MNINKIIYLESQRFEFNVIILNNSKLFENIEDFIEPKQEFSNIKIVEFSIKYVEIIKFSNKEENEEFDKLLKNIIEISINQDVIIRYLVTFKTSENKIIITFRVKQEILSQEVICILLL